MDMASGRVAGDAFLLINSKEIQGDPQLAAEAQKKIDVMKEELILRGEKQKVWCLQDFNIGKPMGQGKFGRVYLAREKKTGIPVAIKQLYKKELYKSSCELQVLREIEIQSHLDHPYILHLLTWFHDEKRIYLVLEFAAHGELYRHMQKMPGKKFSERTTAKYIYQVACALNYCHSRNVIHRDLKPENLLLSLEGDIRLADFGWSVHAPGASRKTMCGTLDYLPPEMVDSQRYDASVDNWCLGVLCYEFLNGKPPFETEVQDDTFKRIRSIDINWPSEFPVGAKDLIVKLLQRDPKKRTSLKGVMKHPWILEHYTPSCLTK